MAIFTLLKSLPKFGHLGAAIARRSTTSNPILLLPSNPKFMHTGSPQDAMNPGAAEAKDAINLGANESMMPGENMMKEPYSTAQHVREKASDMGGMMMSDISEKAKQTMEAAWDSAQRAKDTVVEATKESKEFVKANAESVKKSMNTKNRP